MMTFYNHQQLVATTISTKITAAISFFSSSFIIHDILKQRRCCRLLKCCCKRQSRSDDDGGAQQQYKQLTTMQRILIGMSILDLEASIWFFIGPWAIPVNSATSVYDVDDGALSPKGNSATCTAQGFFLQSGLAIPLYQVSLTAFYYLTVCRNWKEDRQFKKWQWMFLAPPVVWGVSTGKQLVCMCNVHMDWIWYDRLLTLLHLVVLCIALYGAIDGQFNDALMWCFFAGTDKSKALYVGLFYAPLWLSFLTCVILEILIWKKVREQENRISKYTFNKAVPDDSKNKSNTSADERKYSRGVMMQALYFVVAFFLTFIFPTILRLYQVTHPNVQYPPLAMFYLTALFLPSQGFWNLIVYKVCLSRNFVYHELDHERTLI